MGTNPQELRDRTKRFALRVVKLYRALPKSGEAQVMGKQLLRSATSVAANYRAACRARSRGEFLSKLGIVVEESDESLFWIEMITDAGVMPRRRMTDLIQEAGELLAIFAAARHTTRKDIGR